MRNAIVVHGMPTEADYYDPTLPSASNAEWIGWLQKQLMIASITTATPEIPMAFRPEYDIWSKEFERFDIHEDTDLVGYSCGGGFLVRWLSQHTQVRVRRVVLVAPWLDPFREDTSDFFNFKIDASLSERSDSLWILNSDNDSRGVQLSVDFIRTKVHKVCYREFHNFGHFRSCDMVTHGFPQLLQILLKDISSNIKKNAKSTIRRQASPARTEGQLDLGGEARQ